MNIVPMTLMNSPLYTTNLYLVFGLTFLLFWSSLQIGIWRGRKFKSYGEWSLPEVIPTSLLGLLALLLGFSFSLSISRYETRKSIMLQETNAIETSWLRAGFLPEEEAKKVRDALVKYLEYRIAFPSGDASDSELDQYQKDSEEIQTVIWTALEKETRRAPTVALSLLTQSVNQMIDLATDRVFFLRDRIPSFVYWVIMLIAIASLFILGQSFGYKGVSAGGLIGLALLLSLVLALIQDIDRPARGLIRVSNEVPVGLLESLKSRKWL